MLVIPRDPNPYQELLYGALRQTGVRVDYAAELTPSHTLNLLLLPAELLTQRLLGYRILHLHWVFGFGFPGGTRYAGVRRLARLWFAFNLAWARIVGFKLVWTAHNVLPHDQVFDDDIGARRALVHSCELVIAHNRYALDELAALGARPRRSRIVPLGPMATAGRFAGLPRPGSNATRTVLFFGNIAPYKGLDDLLVAVRVAPENLRVVVAGACSDPEYRRHLETLAAQAGRPVKLCLTRVPDHDLEQLFATADALIFPFRTVTTSSSVLLGMMTGRPAVIPDLPALAELPDGAVIRYAAGVHGLRSALARVSSLPAAELVTRGARGRDYASAPSWATIAGETARCFGELIGTAP